MNCTTKLSTPIFMNDKLQYFLDEKLSQPVNGHSTFEFGY